MSRDATEDAVLKMKSFEKCCHFNRYSPKHVGKLQMSRPKGLVLSKTTSISIETESGTIKHGRPKGIAAEAEGLAEVKGTSADQPEISNGLHENLCSLDIQLVQNLVERCLQLYMNQREVVGVLQKQAKIDPSFTALVWQKLEEQNPTFFIAYHARLRIKDQIIVFNQLIQRHFYLLPKNLPDADATIRH